MKMLVIRVPLFDGQNRAWTNTLYVKLIKMFKNVIGNDFAGELEWEIE